MANNKKRDLYSLLHNVSMRMGRGPRQGLAVRPGQNKVLKTIEKHGTNGEMRQQELLRILGIRAGSLSELLRKLENDGYVTRRRSTSDKRDIIVTITEKGHISALENKLSEKERNKALFGCLSEEERSTLATILVKLLDTWDAEDPETEGQRHERRWKEIEQMQDEQREVNALLESVAQE